MRHQQTTRLFFPTLVSVAHSIADRAPRSFAQRRARELRGGAAAEPTREREQNLPAAPWLTDEGRSHPGRLARACRRSDQQGAAMLRAGIGGSSGSTESTGKIIGSGFAQSLSRARRDLAAGPDSRDLSLENAVEA